jgi:hypothetical protein
MDIITKKKLKNKLLPKKKMKVANSNKIIRIIKKFIIKCGMKKQKLKGGTPGIARLLGFKNTDTSTQYSSEDCFGNLKNIDKIFEDIRDDILNAKAKIITDLQHIIEESNKQGGLIGIINKANIIIKNYESAKPKIYEYKTITIEKELLNIMETDTYLLIGALDIALTLYNLREKMLICAENQIAPKDINEYEKSISYLYNITV